MARWAPGARGRLQAAAFELFTEKGYEETTVADIAARAGVTERTFYRYFVDRREVFFDGAQTCRTISFKPSKPRPPILGRWTPSFRRWTRRPSRSSQLGSSWPDSGNG